MHALASSATAEHNTPGWLIERVVRVMGAIDCDPCSNDDDVVNASVRWNKELDGLEQPWHGRVYVNPPGDPRGALPGKFWEKAWVEIHARRVSEMLWLAFNISQLRTLQGACRVLLESCSVCVLSRRIRFSGDSPTKDNAILYYGPNRARFETVFSDIGVCWR